MAMVKTALLTAIGLLLLVLGLPAAVLLSLPFLFLFVGSVVVPLVGIPLFILCSLFEGTTDCVEGLFPFFTAVLDKAMKYTRVWFEFFSPFDIVEHPLLAVFLGNCLFLGGALVLSRVFPAVERQRRNAG
jgi:hypothetical protein